VLGVFLAYVKVTAVMGSPLAPPPTPIELGIIAPFLSSRPVEERVGFAVLGLGGAFLTVVATWMLTAMLFGAFPI
jgi:hypothetical protein